MPAININTTELVELTNKLEKLKRSDLPLTVRGTLNDAAFDMKTKEIEPVFKQKFITRKKTFIRSHTAFNKCLNTFDLKAMYSEAGVIKGKSESGDQLINQEFGGRENKRDFIPTKQARVGNSNIKTIRKANRLNQIKNTRYAGKHNFIKKAIEVGIGGTVVYKKWLFKIKGLNVRNGKIKTVPIYSVKKGRSVRIKKAPFLAPASLRTQKKLDDFYIKNAKYRINKFYKK